MWITRRITWRRALVFDCWSTKASWESARECALLCSDHLLSHSPPCQLLNLHQWFIQPTALSFLITVWILRMQDCWLYCWEILGDKFMVELKPKLSQIVGHQLNHDGFITSQCYVFSEPASLLTQTSVVILQVFSPLLWMKLRLHWATVWKCVNLSLSTTHKQNNEIGNCLSG